MKQIVTFSLFIFALIFQPLKAQGDNDGKEFELGNILLSKGYIKVQMEKMPTGHLHLTGTLNGVTGNFILDTGASGTVIEIKNQTKFKMQIEESDRQAAGAGGANMQMKASSGNDLVLGELQLKNSQLMLMDLDHVNNAFKAFGVPEVDGIIGADILTNNKAIIDYVKLHVYFKNQEN